MSRSTMRDARRERTERHAIRRPIRRRERAEQPAVKRAAQRDDLVLRVALRARPPPRELERAFVRFRARVAEEHLRSANDFSTSAAASCSPGAVAYRFET